MTDQPERKSRDGQTHRFFEEWWSVTSGMSLEERGAFAELCAYAVASSKPVTDAVAMHCIGGLRKWRRLKAALLKRGVISVDGAGVVTPNVLRGRFYKSGYLYRKKPIPAELRWEVFLRDGHKCVECESKTDLTADHILPEAEGGEAVLENLQTLCRRCNGRKGART